jgi:hypothetical protein
MPEGKYFVLISKLGGCAVGYETGPSSGFRLVTVARNDEDDHQLWYIDSLSGTIRNKSNQLCIQSADDGNAVLQKYEKGNGSQQFVLDGHFVKNRTDGRVLDITGASSSSGVPICVWDKHGEPNQQFDAVHLKPRYFTLKGEQSGRVIDIVEENPDAGAKICIYDVQKSDNQLWYEDRNGLIRSKLNDFVFDDSTGDICMQPYEANNPHRSWVINGATIVQLSNPTNVLDVSGESCSNGSSICSYENHDASNQRWIIEYV